MLDLGFIRDHQEKVRQALKGRAPKLDFDAFLKLDADRRSALRELEALRAERNKANDLITQLIKEKKDPKKTIVSMKSISKKIDQFDTKMVDFDFKLREILLIIPNLPHSSVDVGTDSNHNKEVSRFGEPKKFNFKPREHTEIGGGLGLFDNLRASKHSGSVSALYKGSGARLQRALIQFMLDVHTKEHGYLEWWPPFLVNRSSMTGTGQVPKFEEDMYRLKDDDLFLIPTAEVPITNIHRDEILKEEDLPLKYTAYTPCFRREAGSYGKDTKGLVRIHQFDKVELVKFTRPEDSYAEHETLLKDEIGRAHV